MLRLIEALLFLLPFAGYGVWLWIGRRYTTELLWGTVGAMLVLVVVAAYFELTRAVPPNTTYVPPHMENGRIVPAQAVPRTGPR